MPPAVAQLDPLQPAAAFYLLGQVQFDACLGLQQRLVYEAGGRARRQVQVLVCEHPPLITIGRLGSRAHLRVDQQELDSRALEVRWVNRGGGCIVHGPGQLAIYPIVTLDRCGWTLGEYLRRLHAALRSLCKELRIQAETPPGRHGIWGRSGHLAALGVAVKDWTSYHGLFFNVCPSLDQVRLVNSDPWGDAPASSLLAERQQPVKMTAVREGIIRHLAAALGCERYHLHTGHPLLPQYGRATRETTTTVG
jgi:lipoyl(octanoyl) transferase